ncbi:MAG: OmpA family protein [Brumimicrobium sp.]|nr:OmpA family protein [Brumimicrobium sp.]MCO5269132.1 OmpA family protein [Brumimicrobium sp.]
MKYFYWSLILCLNLIQFSFAQVEDESCLPPNKKTQKLLDKAKTSSPQEAADLFRQATESEPDNAQVHYEFALYAYNKGLEAYDRNPNPSVGDGNMRIAEREFQLALDKCKDYHSDCYYYIGVINYSFENSKKAIEYFKKFQQFKSDDVKKYAPDHEKRLQDVAEVLKVYQDEMSFYDNKVPFEPKKVENVSSPVDEYFPMISPDNELMFFTRRVDRKAKGDIMSSIKEEFTWAKRKNIHSPFDIGTPLDIPFNDGTFDSYGAATLSVDNKEMIICACKDEKVNGQTYRNCDLYVTKYRRTGQGGNDYIWSPLENLGSAINTPDGWEGQPSLSADGNILYFTANRPNTQNDDIFFSERLDDNSWGPAQPFSIVNTPGKDKSPFIHQDSETFYFVSSVSQERKGLGGTDIFYMRKDDKGNWTKPKNIGYPINTEDDEIGLFVSIDGKEAYFSSRQRNNWDIYSFDLYEDARPQKVVMVKGELKVEDETELENVEIEITYENSNKVETIKVNSDDGKYAAIVKAKENEDVMLNIKKDGFAFDSQIIVKEDLAKAETITDKNMEIREIKVGEPYTINDILYATASAELNDRSKFILKQFARFLKQNTQYRILIQGHTDNEGNPDNNLSLSDRRANGVKDYLISLGIDKNRLESKGYGQTQPKVPNTSAANKAINRRTDFVIEEM